MLKKRRIKRADKKAGKEKAKPLETRDPDTYERPPSEASNIQKAASRAHLTTTLRVGRHSLLLNPILTGFTEHFSTITAILYTYEAKVRIKMNYVLRNVFRQGNHLQGDYSILNIAQQLTLEPGSPAVGNLAKLVDVIAASVLKSQPVDIPNVSATGFGFLYQGLMKMLAANCKTIAVLNLKRVLAKKIQAVLSVNLDPSIRQDLIASISSLVRLARTSHFNPFV